MPEQSSIDPRDVWQELHSPDDITRERAIRADQRRLDLRELQATAKDLQFLLDRLEQPDLDDRRRQDTYDRIRHLLRRLITVTERRAAA